MNPKRSMSDPKREDKFMKKLVAILKDESGQGMLEYVLLLGVVAIIIAGFKDKIMEIFKSAEQSLQGSTQQVFSGTGQ